MKTVVYTAIIGGYDNLKREPQTGDEFVAFVDGRIKRAVKPWRIVNYSISFGSSALTARWHKMMPHKLFPDCDYSLWIDGSVEMEEDAAVAQLIAKYMQDTDIALFRHSKRNCIYDEAWECIKKRKGDKNAIYRQVNKYTQEGYPSNNGLAETPVLLRRHNKAVNAFNEAWWQEVCNYSVRDQVSFNYLAHKMGVGIKVSYFPGTIGDNLLFRKHPHKETFYGFHGFLWGKIYRAANKMTAKIGRIIRYKMPALYIFLKKFMENAVE